MISQIFELLTFAKNNFSIADVQGMVDGTNRAKGNRNLAITKKTRDNIFQYPLLISESLSTDTLLMLNSAMESRYALFVQMLLNQMDVVDLDDNEDKMSFLRRIHQNDYAFYGGENPIEVSKSLMDQRMNSMKVEDMRIASVEMLQPYQENFNMRSLSGISLQEATLKNSDILGKMDQADLDKYNELLNTKVKDRTKEDKEFIDNVRTSIEQDKLLFRHNLNKNDIKKSNQSEPTILKANIVYKTKGVLQDTSILLGVKCITHPLRTNDIISFVPKSIKNEDILFKTIQWTTGEIKLFKDLILNLDNIKFDANVEDGATKWWIHLKNRSKLAKFRSFFNKDRFIPNATMVFNISEMEHIKHLYNIDLMGRDMDKMAKIFETYFLLGLMVVDETNEVVYDYNDSMKSWQAIPFRSLKSGSKSKPQEIFVKLQK